MNELDAGEKIVDAIIKGKLIKEILKDGKVLDDLVIVWNENAYEQLGKLVSDLTGQITENRGYNA
jgi:hypothetical protein